MGHCWNYVCIVYSVTAIMVAVLEAGSEHPLARAVLDYAYHHLVLGGVPSTPKPLSRTRDFSWVKKFSDLKAEAALSVLVGNTKLVTEQGIPLSQQAANYLHEVEERARTDVLVTVGHDLRKEEHQNDSLSPEVSSSLVLIRGVENDLTKLLCRRTNCARICHLPVPDHSFVAHNNQMVGKTKLVTEQGQQAAAYLCEVEEHPRTGVLVTVVRLLAQSAICIVITK
ncbi:hypothetical protein SELMODRAFT_419325 [Selaginella moellendorffii]|uniref:Uncharacterized protein n=1 Tax=Selaginella moellendorffii TaxID=88036 RepID=D8S8J8_SELML|nr:hypothetical protein SELMODRAFT_419325 [Selaginella moellendorffii]